MLETRGLWVHYGPIPAVRGVDLTVEAGETLVILGRNGAGKSTLLAALSGLKEPTLGNVRLDGRDVTGLLADRRVALGLALVPEGRKIFPRLSVRENLVAGAYRRRLGKREVEGELERVASRFPRLVERMDQRAGSLSGGEAQMLAIARALMSSPRILMLDEPSLGLAPRLVDELYDLLGELRRDGLTLVIVEQYAQLALSFGDRAYVIHKGKVGLAAPASELRGSPELVDLYMAGGGNGGRSAAGAAEAHRGNAGGEAPNRSRSPRRRRRAARP